MIESDKLKEILDILKKDEIDATTSLNILINAVQSSFDKPHFNDLDRALIGKALDCFESKIKLGKNFLIKVN